jgi:beta-phosphoglucomutase-like phosphatase (HAD superfamily)
MKSNNFNKNYHVNEIFDLLNTGLRTHINKAVDKSLNDKDEYKLYEIEERKKRSLATISSYMLEKSVEKDDAEYEKDVEYEEEEDDEEEEDEKEEVVELVEDNPNDKDIKYTVA